MNEYFDNFDVKTLKLQRCFNVASTLFQRWVVILTHGKLWMLYWQRCCNVKITTSNSWYLHNVDTTNSSNSQCCTKTLYSKLTSQHVDVVMATTIQRRNRIVKFTTSFRRHYHKVAPKLRQLCKEPIKCGLFIQGHMVIFPQTCLKVVKKFSNDMKFVW